MATAEQLVRPHTRRVSRWQKAIAMLLGLTMLAMPTSPASGLLGGIIGGIIDDVVDLLDPILDPILGGVSDATGLPLDQVIGDLLDGTVDDLLGTVDRLILPDDGPPLAPPTFEDLAELSLLEPIDPIIEGVLVPDVLDPLGDALAPIGDLDLPLGPASPGSIFDVLIRLIRPALEPLGLDPAAYVIQADYTRPDGTVATVTGDALVDIPRPIDVTGDGIDDISVELRFITAQPSLRVMRLPGAPSNLPVAVSAILAPNGWSSPERMAVGFSAIDDDLPSLSRVTVTDLGLSSNNLSAEIHTSNPGTRLDLTASVYNQGPDNTRLQPTDVRVGFSPVPATSTLHAGDVLAGFEAGSVSLTTSEPTVVDAAVAIGDAAGNTTEVGIVIDRVPGSIDLGFALDGTDSVALDYTASGPVDHLAVRLAETVDGITRSATIGFEGIAATEATFVFSGSDFTYQASADIHAITVELVDPTGIIDRATTVRARLEGLPETMTINLGDSSGSNFGFDAGAGTLDLLEVLLTSGPEFGIDPSVDGVVLEDVAAHYVMAARLTGLQRVEVDMTDGFDATLITTGGRPFVVGITQDANGGQDSITASLSSLPSEVHVALVEGSSTTLQYNASSVVDELRLEIAQTGGLNASVLVEQLPTSIEATLDGSSIGWTASAGVPRIDIDVTDPGGLGEGIEVIRVRLQDVPATFSAELGDGVVSLDATPGAIGSVDILATDGTTSVAVPDGIDGMVLRDTPDGFGLAARITGIRSATLSAEPLVVALQTTGPRVFEIDILTEDVDGSGMSVRATIDELPSSLSIAVSDDDGNPRLDYTGSETVDLLLGTIEQRRPSAEGGGATSISLEAHQLPTALSITLGDAIEYSASAPLPLLRAEVTDTDGLVGLADRLLLELTDLPEAMSFGISDEGVLALTTSGGSIGSLEALLTSGPELSLPMGIDGILLIDEPGTFVATVRVHGLRSMTFDPSEDAAFSLGTAGGHIFELDVRQESADGSRTEVRATLDALPADVSIALGGGDGGDLSLVYTGSSVMDTLVGQMLRTTPGEAPTTARVEIDGLPTELQLIVSEGGVVHYEASGSVPRLALDIESPEGLFGDATSLRLDAFDLPTGIDAVLDEEGAMTIQTSGGPIGLIEALLTSGEAIGLDAAVDGVVLRDLPELFAVFVRLSGVSGLSFGTSEEGASLGIDTNQARVLEVDVHMVNEETGSETEIRATLDAMPASVALELNNTEETTAITYTASGPMDRLFGSMVLTSEEGTNTFGLEVLDLPASIDLVIAEDGTISYSASDRVGQLSIVGENPDGLFLEATSLQALLVDLPPALSVLLAEEGGLSLTTTGGALGHLNVLATNGLELGPVDGVLGAVIHDTADDFVVALRLDDVSHLAVVADPVAIEVSTAGGEIFVLQALFDDGHMVDLGDGAVEIEAIIDALPAELSIGFALDGNAQELAITASDTIDEIGFQLVQTPAGGAPPFSADLMVLEVPNQLTMSIDLSGAVVYSASASVPLLVIDAFDPSGLFDRATELRLRLADLPLGLDLELSEDGAVAIETTGGKLGLMEAQATTGPDNRVPDGFDGILFEDLISRFVVFVRFSNLYSGDVAQVPQPRVNMVTDGGRPLSLGLYQSEPGKPSKIPGVAYTEATLANLPASVNLELLDGAPGTINLDYQASGTADSLTLETNAGDRWITQAAVSNPVPAWFKACQAGDGRCVNSGRPNASVGSFEFLASQHTTLNVLDCARPLNANCTRNNGTQLTHVNNLRVKSFGFEADFDDCGLFGQQACGHLWANTLPAGAANHINNADTMQGQIFNKAGSTELTLNFGANFRAAQRRVVFSRFPSIWPWTLSTTKTGSVNCTSGTNLNVRVQLLFTLNFNANTLLC